MSADQERIEATARAIFDAGPNAGAEWYWEVYGDEDRDRAAKVLAAADRWDREHGYVRIDLAQLEALAGIVASRHKPDERRGGCECGFCAWSVEHVAIASVRDAFDDLPAVRVPLSGATEPSAVVEEVSSGGPVTRSRASAKSAGTRTETAAVRYLAEHVDPRIERRRLSGNRDRGDIAGLHVHGLPLVAEVKDCAKIEYTPWLNEAEIERGNADALASVVIAKRRGRGDPADLLVMMTLRDLVALLVGVRPEEAK